MTDLNANFDLSDEEKRDIERGQHIHYRHRRRRALIKALGGRCAYCGFSMEEKKGFGWAGLEVENAGLHKFPRGKENDRRKYILAHRDEFNLICQLCKSAHIAEAAAVVYAPGNTRPLGPDGKMLILFDPLVVAQNKKVFEYRQRVACPTCRVLPADPYAKLDPYCHNPWHETNKTGPIPGKWV